MKIFRVIAVGLMLVTPVQAQTNGDRLEGFAESLPRNSLQLPMYWFEMESTIGWEKMMLIFGYANNEPPCLMLLNIASAESPMRRFRCSIVN